MWSWGIFHQSMLFFIKIEALSQYLGSLVAS